MARSRLRPIPAVEMRIRSNGKNPLEFSMLFEDEILSCTFKLVKQNNFVKFTVLDDVFSGKKNVGNMTLNASVNGKKDYKIKVKNGLLSKSSDLEKFAGNPDLAPYAEPLNELGTEMFEDNSFPEWSSSDFETSGPDPCLRRYRGGGRVVGTILGGFAGGLLGGAAGAVGISGQPGFTGSEGPAVAGFQNGVVTGGALGWRIGGSIGSFLGRLRCRFRVLEP